MSLPLRGNEELGISIETATKLQQNNSAFLIRNSSFLMWPLRDDHPIVETHVIDQPGPE